MVLLSKYISRYNTINITVSVGSPCEAYYRVATMTCFMLQFVLQKVSILHVKCNYVTSGSQFRVR